MRCIHLDLLALCVSLNAVVAQAPKHPLALVPADVPYYYHIDFEELDKAKLGADLKLVKSFKVKQLIERQTDSWCLIPFMEMKSQTYFVEPQTGDKGIDGQVTINISRKKLDVDAFAKKFDTAKVRGKSAVRDGLTWTIPSGEQSSKTYDFSTDARWTVWDRKVDRPFPKSDIHGLHSAALKWQQDAVFAAGLNATLVPIEMRDPNTLPEWLKFGAPLLGAKALWLDGRFVKDQLVVNFTLEGTSKKHAAEMAAACKTGKPVLVEVIRKSMADFASTQVEPKPLLAWVDTLNKSITDAEVTTKDSLLMVVVSIPMKESLAPVLTAFAGGGTPSDSILGENLHNIGFAFHEEHDKSGSICRAYIANKKNEKLLSWRVHLLPYVGEKELFAKFKLDEPWNSDHNKKVFEENPIPAIYAMEGTDRTKDKLTRFQVFTGSSSLFDSTKPALKIQAIRDGTSNTGLVFLADRAVEWTKPDDLDFDADAKKHIGKLWFDKSGITLVGMADGSVRVMKKQSLTEDRLSAFITPAGGEPYRYGDD